MQHQGWQMPSWWYRNKHPPNDNAYFENMCRVIFEAGLNWHVVDKKWSDIRVAFLGFDIEKVAAFTDADVARLLQNEGIIRNKAKIRAVIGNAQNFAAIQKRYGSFQRYLKSLGKAGNYASAVKDLVNKFKWLGPSSASLFLYSVGEDVEPEQY
ncbi:MAG: DNA-3-methyladenine glycosylase I [Candidatus Bathyarchaeota archaeon]|nr:DNA-3-methyladenine glycosylase I [Candidatus Bathyarchaeota archaeon]